jgi:EpsI family protein
MAAGAAGTAEGRARVNAAVVRWAPAVMLSVGALFTVGIQAQRALELRLPLAAGIPRDVGGLVGRDVVMSDAEVKAAGVTSYLARTYAPATAAPEALPAFSLYVGYYDRQTQGRTIHSPKNCLPGAGWEALAAGTARLTTPSGPVTVNRYLIQRAGQQALVLYWYQGRGRVEANEYRVKWDLLRDAALKRRSEEALARVVVPVTTTEEQAATVAVGVASAIVPALARTLPL